MKKFIISESERSHIMSMHKKLIKEASTTNRTIKDIQDLLLQKGYYVGSTGADNKLGTKTFDSAIQAIKLMGQTQLPDADMAAKDIKAPETAKSTAATDLDKKLDSEITKGAMQADTTKQMAPLKAVGIQKAPTTSGLQVQTTTATSSPTLPEPEKPVSQYPEIQAPVATTKTDTTQAATASTAGTTQAPKKKNLLQRVFGGKEKQTVQNTQQVGGSVASTAQQTAKVPSGSARMGVPAAQASTTQTTTLPNLQGTKR